jgi:hypothetical protein
MENARCELEARHHDTPWCSTPGSSRRKRKQKLPGVQHQRVGSGNDMILTSVQHQEVGHSSWIIKEEMRVCTHVTLHVTLTHHACRLAVPSTTMILLIHI